MGEGRGRRSPARRWAPGLRRTLRHLRPELRTERRLVAGGSVALLLEVAMRLLEPWPLKFVVDGVAAAAGADLATDQPADLGTVLVLACGGLLLVVVLRAVAAYLMTVCFALAGQRVLTAVRERAFAHLQSLSSAFHDTARTGDLVQRVTADVGRLKEIAVTAALPLVGNLVTMVGMVVVVAVLDWRLALTMLAVLPVFALLSVRVSTSITGVSRTQRKAEGALAGLATEALSSMRVVHAYSLQDHVQAAFAAGNAKTLTDGVRAKRLAAGLERRTDVLVGVATAAVLYIGAQRVLAGAITPGDLVVFLTYLKAATKPVRDLAKHTGRLAAAAASGERVADLLEEVPEVADHRHARRARPFRGVVRLEGVQLSYVPGHPVLRGVDLHVHAGQRVAVVGPSGAGKSSLVALLSRLRDPDAGVVRIDGHDLRDLTLESVRSQVAVVLQESLLFATTVRENIAVGRAGASDDDVERAARLAGAHEFVSALPQGYDTVLGERGATLSGGQRQRIAIARAAVRDAPVVVLDEATTGLDARTEREVVAALDRLVRGRTTFVITHDPATAVRCDRVVRLEAGRVVSDERVPPPSLVEAEVVPDATR